MPEATPASLYLQAAYKKALDELIANTPVWDRIPDNFLALALDDAGVRVFVEAAEVVANATWPPSESDVIKLEQALSALTGIATETLDGKGLGSTLGRNTGDK